MNYFGIIVLNLAFNLSRANASLQTQTRKLLNVLGKVFFICGYTFFLIPRFVGSVIKGSTIHIPYSGYK